MAIGKNAMASLALLSRSLKSMAHTQYTIIVVTDTPTAIPLSQRLSASAKAKKTQVATISAIFKTR